jgi:glycerol uptake facilitator protein
MLSSLLPHTGHFPATAAELLLVALGLGLALFIAVMMFGRISGGHINPAVTIGLAATGDFAWSDVVPYIIAQLVGAIVGALGIAIIYGRVASTVGHLGAPALSRTTSIWQGFIAEAVGAAILMLAIFATAVDRRAPAGWAGLVIGLTLAVAILMLGPATGGSLNPARAFGPDLVNIFFGTSVNWGDFLLCYTVGPILGMIAAAFLYRYVAQLARPGQAHR